MTSELSRFRRESSRIAVIASLLGLLFAFCAESVWAVPSLQLDISGGTYNSTTQTVAANSNPFTLYAYLIPDQNALLTDTYYISAALLPQTSSSASLGSFVFASQTIQVTQNMVYGVPPIEADVTSDPHDLPQHGVFPTYFTQFSFQFDASHLATAYDTEANPGSSPTPNPKGTMYYAGFTVDTSLLDSNYTIHFDLYNTTSHTTTSQDCVLSGKGKLKTYTCTSYSVTDVDINCFAAFSHDAESGHPPPPLLQPVPEPMSLLLLAVGFLGIPFIARKIVR